VVRRRLYADIREESVIIMRVYSELRLSVDVQFSNDQSTIDFMIPILLGTVLGASFQALGILFVVCQVTWQLIIIVAPLAVVFVSYRVKTLSVLVP
jgi:hypothetical protein